MTVVSNWILRIVEFYWFWYQQLHFWHEDIPITIYHQVLKYGKSVNTIATPENTNLSSQNKVCNSDKSTDHCYQRKITKGLKHPNHFAFNKRHLTLLYAVIIT